jgi:hypothetical protein
MKPLGLGLRGLAGIAPRVAGIKTHLRVSPGGGPSQTVRSETGLYGLG